MIDSISYKISFSWYSLPSRIRDALYALTVSLVGYIMSEMTIRAFFGPLDPVYAFLHELFQGGFFLVLGMLIFTRKRQHNFIYDMQATGTLPRYDKVIEKELDALTEKLMERERSLELKSEWFKTILQTTTDGFIAVNTKNEIIFVNDSAVRILGYNCFGYMRGKIISDIIPSFSKSLIVESVFIVDAIQKNGKKISLPISVFSGGLGCNEFSLIVIRDRRSKKRLDTECI